MRNLRGGATPQRVTKRRGMKELGKKNMRNITVCQLGPDTTQRQHGTFRVALVHAFVCQTAPVICASKMHTTSLIQDSIIGFNTAGPDAKKWPPGDLRHHSLSGGASRRGLSSTQRSDTARLYQCRGVPVSISTRCRHSRSTCRRQIRVSSRTASYPVTAAT